MLQTATYPEASCPRCDWSGQRGKRGGIPSHRAVVAGATRAAAAARRVACDGPSLDGAVARALGEAFAAAGRAPMPNRDRLTVTIARDPDVAFGNKDLYRACPTWARYVVTIHAPLPRDWRHDVERDIASPPGRRTVQHVFATRQKAEEWAHACARMLGPVGARASTHGYVTVGALHRVMRLWHSWMLESRAHTGPESPETYTAIDPGDVVYRHHDPYWQGYGDIPCDAWDAGGFR